jgi:hypothetical protein
MSSQCLIEGKPWRNLLIDRASTSLSRELFLECGLVMLGKLNLLAIWAPGLGKSERNVAWQKVDSSWLNEISWRD